MLLDSERRVRPILSCNNRENTFIYSCYQLFGDTSDMRLWFIATVDHRSLIEVGAMGAMAPTLFENMLIGTHTFREESYEF